MVFGGRGTDKGSGSIVVLYEFVIGYMDIMGGIRV